MYVCVCNAVTDRDVRAAVAEGARTLADLRRSLGVGICCGRCEPYARGLVGDAPVESAPSAAGDD